MRRVLPACALAILFLLVCPAALQAQQNQKVFIVSKYSQDAASKAKYEKLGGGAGLASVVSGAAQNQLLKAYPCLDLMTEENVGVALNFEKARQLLGLSPDEDFLSEIGGAVGARYIIVLTVTGLGERWTLEGGLLDDKTARRIASSQKTFDDFDDVKKGADAFGRSFINSAGLPTCPDSRVWTGMITVALSRDHTELNRNGGDTHYTGKATLNCVLLAGNSGAACTYSSSYTTTSSGGSVTLDKSAEDAPASVRVSISNDKLILAMGKIPVMVTVKDTNGTPGLGSDRDTVDLGTYEVPAGLDPTRQSGMWTNPNPTMKEMGIKETVTWSLSKR
jgi:hypothetical protein